MKIKLFIFASVAIILMSVLVSSQLSASSLSGGNDLRGGSYSSYGGYRSFSGYSPGASSANRQYSQPNLQTIYSSSDIKTYWPILNDDPSTCEGRQDLILQIAPGGCEPAVIRSDLLAEQDVPVFCQVDSFKLNPLINIKEIRNIRFSGARSEFVTGVGFHPARAALRSYNNLLGDPLINNIGYAVVILKKNPVESKLPNEVILNLNASVDYYSGNAIGVGRAEFILSPISDAEWEKERNKQSFWQGRYFVRLEEASPEFALVSIYYGDRKINTLRVDRGQTSREFFVPGAYCQAGLQVVYDGFEAPKSKATLEISDEIGTDIIDVYKGSRFLNDKCSVVELYTRSDEEGTVLINCGGSERIRLDLRNRINNSEGKKELKDKQKAGNASAYFTNAIENYEEVADDFAQVPKLDNVKNSASWGEEALWEGILLAREFNNANTEERLIREFLENYPGSDRRFELNSRLTELFEKDSSLAGINVNLDNGVKNIRLVRLKHYEIEGIGADFIVGNDNRNVNVKLGEEKRINGKKSIIRLDRIIDKNRVEATVFCDDGSLRNILREDRYGINEFESYRSREEQGTRLILEVDKEGQDTCKNGEVIKLKRANGEFFAKVRLLPKVRGTRSEVPLTVGIGIEKRAIKLSPERTAEMIDNLNDTIDKWSKINEKLGTTVKGLKTACFATSAALMAKNFITGIGGEGLARKKVMEGPSGWNNICEAAVAKGEVLDPKHETYVNLNDCLTENAAKIKADVNKMEEIIESYNNKITNAEKASGFVSSEGLFGDKVINTEKSANFLLGDLKSQLKNDNIKFNINNKSYSSADFEKTLNDDAWNKGYISLEQIKDLKVYSDILKDPSAGDTLKKSAERKIAEIQDSSKQRIDASASSDRIAESLKGLGVSDPAIDVYENANTIKGIYRGQKYEGNVPGVDSSDKGKEVQYVKYSSGTYMVILNKDRDSLFSPQKIYRLDESNGKVNAVNSESAQALAKDEIERKDIRDKFANLERFRFQRFDAASYKNIYLNPKIRYYETEPYKGLPALVPFDTQSGWYAGTKQVLPIFGGPSPSQGTFESSGRASSFWVCNVGENGREEFSITGFGDDACMQFNFFTGQPINTFPGLGESESRQLVQRATNALNDAARQYGKGLRSIRIGNEIFNVGDPAVNVPAVQCQNFMDPTDCQIMFNVCDPVICPSSRCNLGGTFYVPDVIQSGIVGSALLCLPNFREGIYVPVCLTGLHAGIDAYLSILKQHQSCLQESLDTGQNIGICDQITSVYLCEFFWRQIAPASKIIIPTLFELFTGQGTRGGGEYLTVMSAWENTQNSIDYFTQEYAVNALEAYKIRSVGEVGTQFCKSFVSAKGPTSFENLVEPDSPVQFHAWFDATPFTTATVVPTAQYKVFYHIYAGKDQGVQYFVYLKNPPESSFYTSPQIVVANGFIARGQSASQSRDFTAPTGYKELCVSVNGQEKCGFGQVSTSFALNYIKDEFVSSELERDDITSERACISGGGEGIRAGALLNPNIQAGIEDALLPEVYNRGIVRVCATDNPGSSTNPTRFVDVGHCGSERVRCWLDKRSLDNAISDGNAGAVNETLQVINNLQQQRLKEQEGALYGEAADSAIQKMKDLLDIPGISKLKDNSNINAKVSDSVKKINELLVQIVIENDKAELVFMKAQVYDNAARATLKIVDVDKDRLITGTKPAITEAKNIETSGLSLNRDFAFGDTEKNYISLESSGSKEKTDIYLEGRLIKLDDKTVGSVNEDKSINILPNSEQEVKENLGGIDIKGAKIDKESIIIVSNAKEQSGAEKRYSNEILLIFYTAINDYVWLRWNYELNKPEFSVIPNGFFKDSSIATKMKNEGWTSDINALKKKDVAPLFETQDLFLVEDIITLSTSASEFSNNIRKAISTKRASINNDGNYNVNVENINKLLYGGTQAGAATQDGSTLSAAYEDGVKHGKEIANDLNSLPSNLVLYIKNNLKRDEWDDFKKGLVQAFSEGNKEGKIGSINADDFFKAAEDKEYFTLGEQEGDKYLRNSKNSSLYYAGEEGCKIRQAAKDSGKLWQSMAWGAGFTSKVGDDGSTYRAALLSLPFGCV